MMQLAKSKSETRAKHFVYIVQSSLEPAKCKIGITDNLERRLREYNAATGLSRDNIYSYLFTCEVKNMRAVENDVKNNFPHLCEQSSREIYFYNAPLFDGYVDFIKSHKLFVREIFIAQAAGAVIKIIKKTTPTLRERGMTKRDIMERAKKAANDEFYTLYEDVEKEIRMYPSHIWRDKCVFCNCDDAVGETRSDRDSSAFALFFIRNFCELGLKKLICAHYSGQMDLFNAGAKGYIFTKDGAQEMLDMPRGFNGSFDDPLSLQILRDDADIVCTNPPFSRAKDYWKIIIESGKKFLIISNETNVKNNSYIPYFMDKKVWSGYNRVYTYLNPKREIVRAAGRWYTNIPVKNRPTTENIKIIPLKEIPEKYKKYDDEKVLLIDNSFIPLDYKRTFAVSVAPILNGILEKGYKIVSDKEYVPYIDGKRCFGRILIRKM
jgi:hypothetical protein